jgi:hypothetical protein
VARLGVVVAITIAVVDLGPGASVQATHNPSSYFVTPSRNIICAWHAGDAQSRPSLRCDIGTGLNPRPRRPSWCDVDWAYGLSMTSVGRASPICAGDSVFQGWRPVLAYGHSWRKRGFTCRSRAVGLTCRNTQGHGFFLSRETWRRF